MRQSRFILCWFPVLALLGPLPLRAAGTGDDRACEVAAHAAAEATRVPEPLLRAVTLAETGLARHGRMTSWPWTLNVAGQGYWFATRGEAEQFLEAALADGARNADIGCFQISHLWHGNSFPTVAAMLDPDGNALHAARYLSDLKKRHGTWDAAVAAYHSSRPEAGRRYLLRVAGMLEQTGEVPVLSRASEAVRPVGNASASGLGSIFPLPDPDRPLIAGGTE